MTLNIPEALGSVRVAIVQYPDDSLHQDPKIEGRRPVPQILEVIFDPAMHVFELAGFAAATVHLCESSDSRWHFMADHVALDQPAILLIMRDRMRSWTDEAHVALEHVDELGQLVNGVAAQPTPDRGDPFVALGRLLNDGPVFRDGHGPELEHIDDLSIQAIAPLAEDCGTGRSQLDQHSNEQQEWRQHDQRDQADADVHAALDQARCALERGFTHGNDRHALDLGSTRLDQVDDENIRHEIDRGSRVAQLLEQSHHALHLPHGQRDEDQIDVIAVYVPREVGKTANQRRALPQAQSLGAAIVEETLHDDPILTVAPDALHELQAHVVVTCNHGLACVRGRMHESADEFVEPDAHDDQWDRSQRRPGQDHAARIFGGGLCHIADREQHREQQHPPQDEAHGNRPGARQELDRRNPGPAQYGRRKDRDKYRKHAKLLVEFSAMQYRNAVQHPDRDQRRRKELHQRQLPDQDTAFKYDRFVHRSPNAHCPCSAHRMV